MSKGTLVWTMVLAVCVGVVLRMLFPQTVQLPAPPPKIVTMWDTVQTLDTTFIERVREIVRRDTVNLVEVVTVAVPETMSVCPNVKGLTSLLVGEHIGDSTIVGGFALTALDSGVSVTGWRSKVWTAGPLRALLVDSLPPRLSFYPPPKPCTCGFWQTVTRVGLGALGGWAACKIP